MAVNMTACPVVVFLLFFTETANCAISGWATCDNEMWLYADGVLKEHNRNWREASRVTLPDNTRVIAIKCVDVGVVAGIRAAFDNGITTDRSWKCNTSPTPGWMTPGFNDASWVSATEIPINVEHTYWQGWPRELTNSGPWIWTARYAGGHKQVFCRKEIPPSCCSNLSAEMKSLKQDLTSQLASIRDSLNSKMDTVMKTCKSPNTEVLQTIQKLSKKVEEVCSFSYTPVD
jgi:hypothetical protein